MTIPTTARTRQRVLIVDGSNESRYVLTTALQRRGIETLEAEKADEGLKLARRYQPSLIVLDLEAAPSDANVRAGYADATGRQDTPLVLLGTARAEGTGLPDGAFVSKPYHYGPLVQRIESLLETDACAASD